MLLRKKKNVIQSFAVTRKNKCIISRPLVGLLLPPRASPGSDNLWVRQSRTGKIFSI